MKNLNGPVPEVYIIHSRGKKSSRLRATNNYEFTQKQVLRLKVKLANY